MSILNRQDRILMKTKNTYYPGNITQQTKMEITKENINKMTKEELKAALRKLLDNYEKLEFQLRQKQLQ
jgi:hypothetical protein